jgi:hypothetical protein
MNSNHRSTGAKSGAPTQCTASSSAGFCACSCSIAFKIGSQVSAPAMSPSSINLSARGRHDDLSDDVPHRQG